MLDCGFQKHGFESPALHFFFFFTLKAQGCRSQGFKPGLLSSLVLFFFVPGMGFNVRFCFFCMGFNVTSFFDSFFSPFCFGTLYSPPGDFSRYPRSMFFLGR